MKFIKLDTPLRLFHEKKNLFSDTGKKCISPNKIKALIVFGKMHFLRISENNFFAWNKAYRNDKFHGFLDFYSTKKRLVKILERVLHKTLYFQMGSSRSIKKEPMESFDITLLVFLGTLYTA